MRGIVGASGVVLACLVASVCAACAETLPVTRYTLANGLARDHVTDLLVDRDGFVWIATAEGLSRFDGQQFLNFGPAEGLPHRDARLLRQDTAGDLWLVSGERLCRVDDEGGARFACSPPFRGFVTDSLARTDGSFLLSTTAGLFRARLDRRRAAWDIALLDPEQEINSLVEDGQGTTWAVADFQLMKLDGGSLRRHASLPRRALPPVLTHLFRDATGAPWVVAGDALYEVDTRAGLATTGLRRIDLPRTGRIPPTLSIGVVLRDGSFTLGGGAGLVDAGRDPRRAAWRVYGGGDGLPTGPVNAIAEDAAGNVWLGTTVGLARIAAGGFTSWTTADGLARSAVVEVFDGGDGRPCVRTQEEAAFECLGDEGSFRPLRLRHDPALTYFGWGWRQTTLHARDGRWWVASGSGVLRYPAAATLAAVRDGTPALLRAGLPGGNVFRIFEDRAGTVWVGVAGSLPHLSRWNERGRRFESVEGPAGECLPTVFREAPDGALWIGCYSGDLVRARDGRFERVVLGDPAPRDRVEDALFDRRRRLWVATRSGLYRTDRPAEPRVAFRRLGTGDGLGSEDVWSLLEDDAGVVWIGHGRGIDRFDPESGAVRHVTTMAGLAGAQQTVAWRGPDGTLWFGGPQGLSASRGRGNAPPAPATPRLVALVAGGVSRALAGRGVTELPSFDLGPESRSLELRFVSPGLFGSTPPRYRVRITGGGAPLELNSTNGLVTLAAPGAGTYALEARAIDETGHASATPARVAFRILPPFYARWWFLVLAGAGAAASIALLVRARVRKRLELERVRTRIASDLHDDLGASLSKVAISSEVLAARLPAEAADLAPRLHGIAEHAREMVDSLGDIVWSVDPRLDRWSDLAGRMRHFGGEFLLPLGIEFELAEEGVDGDRPLAAELRRALFLAFKEGVNNAAKYARASRVDVRLRVAGRAIVLSVKDDGRGFDPAAVARGRGIDSLEARARALGGQCAVRPVAGGGTELEFRVPA